MDEHEAIFRKVAVGRLSRPDELTEMLGVVRPFDWLILSAIGLLVGAVLIWSVATTLPITVAAQGIVQPQGGVTDVLAPQPGRVTRVWVAGGDMAEAGAPLVKLGRDVVVSAPFRARVLEVDVAPGDQAAADAPLLTLEPADRPLQAVLFLPESMAHQIRPGLAVRLRPQDIPPLNGTVSRVAPAPSSDRALRQALNREALVRSCIAQNRRLRVDVAMEPRNLVAAPVGMEVGGEIVVGQERPIAWVLPWLRSLKFFNSRP